MGTDRKNNETSVPDILLFWHEFNITLNNTETYIMIRERARYKSHFTYTNVEADKTSRSFMIKAVWG